jgi:hypothetical protein
MPLALAGRVPDRMQASSSAGLSTCSSPQMTGSAGSAS